MRESTKLVFRKHGLRVDRAIHNYLYFAFYAPYTKIALYGTRFLVKYLSWFRPLGLVARFVFDRYHSKVLSYGNAKKILTLNVDVNIVSDDNKRMVPFKYATKIIFQEPEFIAVMDCPCKLAREDPCEPVNCCIAVGKSLATLWLERCQKYNPRKITQEEALEIIKEYRKKGHITQAFFKVATGGNTGVICNCCPKCCVSLEATRLVKRIDKGLSMNAASGYSVARDTEKCQSCGTCSTVCPFDAIEMRNGSPTYDRDFCMGCELCVENCPQEALSLYRDQDKTLPLDIDLVREELMAG